MEFHLDKPNNSAIVNYSYQLNTLYEKTVEKDHYIKWNFQSKQPNISSSLFDSNYKSSKLYISKKIHSIKGVDFDGELIIEHIPTTNGFTKFYVCIPLKTMSGSHTIIDDLIQNTKNIEIDINTFLPTSSTGILYSSSIFPYLSDTVLVFTQPITIGSSLSSFDSINLFRPFSETPTFVTIKKYQHLEVEGFQEGLETKNLYCQPVDINDPSNNDILTVALPTGNPSEYASTTQMMSLTQNFMVFFVILLGIFGITPYGYDLIIGLINSANKKLGQNLKMKDKAGMLYGFDALFSIVFFLMSVSLMYNGIITNTPSLITVGFFLFLSFIFIFIRIQIYKYMTFDGGFSEFINTKFLSTSEDKISDSDVISPDFYGLIVGSTSTIIERNQVITFIIFMALFYGLAWFLKLLDGGSTVKIILGIVFIILSFILSYFAAVFTKKKGDIE